MGRVRVLRPKIQICVRGTRSGELQTRSASGARFAFGRGQRVRPFPISSGHKNWNKQKLEQDFMSVLNVCFMSVLKEP